MALIHVIASCTDRKRLPIPARLRLRAIPGRTLVGRFDAWQDRVSSASTGTLPAADLYCGDHWSIARVLTETTGAQGWRVCLWAASAGYGLIPAEASIAPYSATFATGHPDSVVPTWATNVREDLRAWWKLQGSAVGPDATSVRRLTDLAATRPGVLLVIASDAYIDAMEDDLLAARAVLPDPDHLVVVSARPRRSTELGANWVETNARLRKVLGGAVGSLNARVARHLLTNLDPAQFSATAARALANELLATTPALPVYDRTPSTDDRVAAFIERAIRRDPSVSHTPLLRAFRAAGNQCEQRRFRTLFERVTRKL